MSIKDEISAFINGSAAKSFTFEDIGDAVEGTIVALDLRQQTDLQTGEPLTWNDGSPRKVLVITLQTELQDDEADEGLRAVWCKGGNYTVATGKGVSSLTAVKDALRAVNAKDLEEGGFMRMELTGRGKATTKGFTQPNLYTATYGVPVAHVSMDELS